MATHDEQVRELLALVAKRQESTNRWLEEVSRKLSGREQSRTVKWGVFWGIVLAVLVYILLFLVAAFVVQEWGGVGFFSYINRR